MSLAFPYTYVSCPCSDIPIRKNAFPKRYSRHVQEELELEETTLNPHSLRSNFSLFPPSHIYYCEDCHELKCPRCVTEEIICWYCPQCLMETAPSAVKSEGHLNRCDGNCFTCPICEAQCVTSPITGRDGKGTEYLLSCNFCMWTSLECGISFKDSKTIRRQLERRLASTNHKRPGHERMATQDLLGTSDRGSALSKEYDQSQVGLGSTEESKPKKALDVTARFEALKEFYREQLSASDLGPGSNLDFSPSSLTRLMTLYSSTGTGGTNMLQQKRKAKPNVVREAVNAAEGLQLSTSASHGTREGESSDDGSIPTLAQLARQFPTSLGNPNARDMTALLPLPTLLTTKRAKRCSACTHILVKPELKVTSTRYRIKLMALNTIPTISVRPVPVTGGLLPADIDGEENVYLEPGRPSQWIVTFRNPLFEDVDVSLGCPNTTPGRLGHRVTVLCPHFSMGKSGDGWDDALDSNTSVGLPKSDTNVSISGYGGEQIAGKVYDRGRNWTSVVFEIVPVGVALAKGEELTRDEDVIEIPVRVRLNWKVSDEQMLKASYAARASSVDLGSAEEKKAPDEPDDGRREVEYWTVLGIGRVRT